MSTTEMLLWALIIVVGSQEMRRWCNWKRDDDEKFTHNPGDMMPKKGKPKPTRKPTRKGGY